MSSGQKPRTTNDASARSAARSKNTADRVARSLLGSIIAGTYPAGLRLPAEVELAESFGCGRSTIREALRELSAMGVVRSRRGSGVVVLDFRLDGTPSLLPAYLAAGAGDADPLVLATELLRIRSLLAKEAVRLAALYAKPEAIGDARAKLGEWSAEKSPAEQARAEIALFRALVGASRVWPAIWLANAYFGPLDDLHAQFAPLVGGSPADFGASMARLLDLVEAGDEPSASRHFATWIDRVDRSLVDRLTAVLPSSGAAARGDGAPATPRRATQKTQTRSAAREASPALRSDVSDLPHRGEHGAEPREEAVR